MHIGWSRFIRVGGCISSQPKADVLVLICISICICCLCCQLRVIFGVLCFTILFAQYDLTYDNNQWKAGYRNVPIQVQPSLPTMRRRYASARGTTPHVAHLALAWQLVSWQHLVGAAVNQLRLCWFGSLTRWHALNELHQTFNYRLHEFLKPCRLDDSLGYFRNQCSTSG